VPLEREVKLRFPSAANARQHIFSSGLNAIPLRPRRLQQDTLLDTADRSLYARGCALRLRRDDTHAYVTFKGPPQPGTMKLREEHETTLASVDVLATIFGELGFIRWFRYEKYREEFSADHLVIAIDETPIGVFVEVEGDEDRISAAARALGKTADDYVTASYRALYVEHCRVHGLEPGDMLF
jgi:adenylate cyclase class 2